jgi:Zn-finger nucleic acid-binding protein
MTTTMMCPACQVPLVMTERHGVEIDACQRCRGVWLDRGELDKILQREAAYETGAAGPDRRRDRYDDDRDDRGFKRKPRSIWTELFD